MGERGWDKVIAICPSFTQTIIAKSKWEGVRGRGILILAGGGLTRMCSPSEHPPATSIAGYTITILIQREDSETNTILMSCGASPPSLRKGGADVQGGGGGKLPSATVLTN